MIEKMQERLEKVWNKAKTRRVDLDDAENELRKNKKFVARTVVATFVVTAFMCAVVFLLNVRGAEEVLVPDVRGKELAIALMELQAKELYPRVQLRYTDSQEDAGLILEQTPRAGAIVRGYSRVSLVVSRGVLIDSVENYVGKNFSEVLQNWQVVFGASAKPLIVLEEPEYVFANQPSGAIIAQEPPAGTGVASQTKVRLVVSKGNQTEKTTVPNLIGKSLFEIYKQMATSKILFDFSKNNSSDASANAVTVVSQSIEKGASVTAFSRMTVGINLPVKPDNACGIFSADLPKFPYALNVSFVAVTPDGNRETLTTFKHSGQKISVPYDVPHGTILEFVIEGSARATMIVE